MWYFNPEIVSVQSRDCIKVLKYYVLTIYLSSEIKLKSMFENVIFFDIVQQLFSFACEINREE